MPTYYIMDLADDMPAAVAKEMPSPQEIAACRWLPDDELARLCRRVRAHRLSGRPQLVPFAQRRRVRGRAAVVLRAHHRRAVDLHLGHERLGRLSAAGCGRAHAGHGVHSHGRLPPARRGRALGAAGAGGTGQRLAPGVPEGTVVVPLIVCSTPAGSARASWPAAPAPLRLPLLDRTMRAGRRDDSIRSPCCGAE